MYVFLDESGDLGFKKTSSRWFLFTMAVVFDARALERVVKKIWRPLKKKHKTLGELHAYHADRATRIRMLKKLREVKDLRILCIVLDKKKVGLNLQNEKNYLYNYAANILLKRLIKSGGLTIDSIINLCIDRKDTKKQLRENFLKYLTRGMSETRKAAFSVQLLPSYDNKSLQAVDFISWAIFRKYEQDDNEYYEIIKDKMIDERFLSP